jgi:hypothetical protein
MPEPEVMLLPTSYVFADKTDITPQEVIQLRNACEWGTEQDPAVWQAY